MKGNRQSEVQDLESVPTLNAETKYVTVAIFENEGKTILQPLITEQEAKEVQKIFRNETLEVWLSNGKPDYSVFDIDIKKYREVSQPFTKCSKITNQVCLKNLFESKVCCGQCPLYNEVGGM